MCSFPVDYARVWPPCLHKSLQMHCQPIKRAFEKTASRCAISITMTALSEHSVHMAP